MEASNRMRRQAPQGQLLWLQPWITKSRLRRVGQSWMSQRRERRGGRWRWSQSRFDPSLSCHICATYTTPALYMVHFRKIHKDGTMPVQSFDLSGISLVRCGYCRWICRTNGLSEHQGQSGACSGRGQTDNQALDGVSRSHKELLHLFNNSSPSSA